METSFRKVDAFIQRHSLLDDATGVLVAVSGGPDSVALLDILLRLGEWVGDCELRAGHVREPRSSSAELQSNAQPPSPIPYLHIAHLDHKLRGRESALDAEFVRGLARRLGIGFTTEAIDIRAEVAASNRGVEETARAIRYDFLRREAEACGCNRIAVGHTMTDQAETFLMRLIRGAGSRGLAAMRPASGTPRGRPGEWASGGVAEVAQSPGRIVSPSPLLIRPLLCITREEVEAYCSERRLEFRTDITNCDSRYTRNRIRSQIIPAMTAVNPRVVESIARAAENLANDQDAIDALSSRFLDQAGFENSKSNDGTVAYSAKALLEQPIGMRRRMILKALTLARIAEGEIASTHVREIESLLQENASGKHISIPGGLDVWREFDALIIKRSLPESGDYQLAISGSNPTARAGNFTITLRRDLSGAIRNSVVEATQLEKQRTGFDWMGVALVDCSLPDCLVIRPRRSGERARVIGHAKTKKLKKLMIDHRIPSSRRARWPVVTTPDGRYVWSPGLPPAFEFTASDESQRIAILQGSII